jgi:hypothetical protein
MLKPPRRALLGALIVAPVVALPVSAEGAPSDPSWLDLEARWCAACADYNAAVAAQEAAELALAAEATPATEAAELRAYQHARRTATRCRRLSEAAAMKPANDWPALAIKLEIAGQDGNGAGLDVLACDLRPQHWQRLVSEIRAVMRSRAA